MTQPTVNWNLVEVRGHYVGLDAVPAVGSVQFTPSAVRWQDQAALISIIPRTLSVTLDSNGEFSIQLPATDDPDITPIDFTYTIREVFEGGLTYAISVPIAAAGTGIDLPLVTPVQPSGGEYYLVGPIGPAPTLEVGDVDTVPYGTDPTVEFEYLGDGAYQVNYEVPMGADRFLVWNGTSYPARPDLNPVIFNGPVNPNSLGLMFNGDTWINPTDDPADEIAYALRSEACVINPTDPGYGAMWIQPDGKGNYNIWIGG